MLSAVLRDRRRIDRVRATDLVGFRALVHIAIGALVVWSFAVTLF